MPRVLTVMALATVIAFVAGREASAQSLFSGNGALGQTPGIPSAGGGAGGGQIPGAGGAGQSGGAGTAFQTNIATELGALSDTIGQGGFIGRNNQGFVGNAQAGQTTAQRNTGLSGLGNRGRGGGNFNTSRNQGNSNQTVRMIRPRQRVAFKHPVHEPQSVKTQLEGRFTRLADRDNFPDNVGLSIDEKNVVTLKGEVATEAEKRLAELMVRLEPGVRGIQNELTVR